MHSFNQKQSKGPIKQMNNGTMQCQTQGKCFFASFSPTQLSFSHPVPYCLINKCTCTHLFAHGHAGLKTRSVLAHCYCYYIKVTENNCAIDQHKCGLKSMAQYLFYLRGMFVLCTMGAKCAWHTHSSYYTYRDMQQHTNMPDIKNKINKL